MNNKIMRSVLFIILSLTIFSLVNCACVRAGQKSKGVRTVYLIRHGDYAPQTEGIPDAKMVLTPLGIAQARLVSGRLKSMDINFNALISSTMMRAVETAEVINKDFPDLKQEQSDLISECTPPAWNKDVMAGIDTTMSEGCVKNLEQAFQKYFIPSPDEKERNDIIVCHGNVIRYFVTKALKVDTKAWVQMSITNCSLTIIRILPDGSMKLDAFGDYGHIPENLRTFTGGKNEPKGLLMDAGKKKSAK